MDNNKPAPAVLKKSHAVTVENRAKAFLTGVTKVLSTNDSSVLLDTSEGGLAITGTGLKIVKFDVETGALAVEGTFNQLKYSAAKEPFVKRIFK